MKLKPQNNVLKGSCFGENGIYIFQCTIDQQTNFSFRLFVLKVCHVQPLCNVVHICKLIPHVKFLVYFVMPKKNRMYFEVQTCSSGLITLGLLLLTGTNFSGFGK